MADYAVEVEHGERFEFGKNWVRFLAVLNDDHIEEAKISLKKMLNVESLAGKMFLDVGSGSGLFSLAARMLGATVYSFDYDPQSVECTKELKQRYFAEDKDWIVVRGSVLDKEYLSNLGQYDVVYSWGVLHHTGAMWEALDNITPLVASGGQLFIAIYNNQGRASKRWLTIKKFYNALPPSMRFLILIPCAIRLQLPTMIRDLLSGQPLLTWREYSKNRGMSPLYDIVDWVGGYPFEVAKPEEIFNFYRDNGFYLQQLKTCAGGLGCNQFVFSRYAI
jgi:2-polyprenyl-6-hydroxyphenyl methylase/3-demethylubiquinone-9 3-methyltransferase